MARFLGFFKEYWFGMLTSLILLVGFLFFLLVLLSPRQDIQKRGFIPCTETLAQNILNCPTDTKYRCIFAEIMQNSWCDIKVIGTGLTSWIQGRQSTPWANYIFRPEVYPADQNRDELDAEFYNSSAHPELDLLKLQQLNEIIEKNNAEIRERQNNNKTENSVDETSYPNNQIEKQPRKEKNNDNKE